MSKKIVAYFSASGMGNTDAELLPSCKGAVLKEGKRFIANTSKNELKIWAENL